MMNLVNKFLISGFLLAATTSCGFLDQWDDNDAHAQEDQAIQIEAPAAEKPSKPVEPPPVPDEIASNEINKLPAQVEGPHIIKRDGKYWIIAEPSSQMANVLDALNDTNKNIKFEGAPGYLRLASELNYRINEMTFNTNGTMEDYRALYEMTLKTIEKVAVAEAEKNAYLECIKACQESGKCSDSKDCDDSSEKDCEGGSCEVKGDSEELTEETKLELITEHK